MRYWHKALIATVIAAFTLTGCATRKPDPPASAPHPSSAAASAGADGTQQVTIYTDDTMKFYPSTISAKVGTLQVTLVNKSKGTPHNLVWRPNGPSGTIQYLAGGDQKTFTVTIPAAGSFQFVCTFHEQMGMTGTLIATQ